MRLWLIALTVTMVWVGAAAAQESKVKQSDTALIVIDIQNFYFEGGRLPLSGSVEASLKARALVDLFRSKGWPVVHVRHVPKDKLGADGEPADPQFAFHPNVQPQAGEKIVTKQQINSFLDTDLLPFLKGQGVKKLVLVGMQTHMCLEAAARAAHDFGFDVTVIHDACATRDLSFGGRTIPAAQVHAAVWATLADHYAHVVSLVEWSTPKEKP